MLLAERVLWVDVSSVLLVPAPHPIGPKNVVISHNIRDIYGIVATWN